MTGAGAGARLASLYRGHRYAVLFYTLLGTLAAGPLLTALHFSGDLLQIFLAFNLLAALVPVAGRRRRAILLLIAAVVVGVQMSPASLVGERIATGALLVGSAIGMLAAAAALRFALRARVIETEHVFAALSAYLLAGLLFGVLHWVVATVRPGSFGTVADPPVFTLSTGIYFSFVTIATVGYGDVVPKTELSRGLAILEAIAGQLFIAVTIARLVAGQRPR